MTTSIQCNTGRMCVILHIFTRENTSLNTLFGKSNTCAENRKLSGLKFDTLYWRHLGAYRKI